VATSINSSSIELIRWNRRWQIGFVLYEHVCIVALLIR
jgi:hypothetical protein